MFTHLDLIQPEQLKSVDTPNGRFYFPPRGGKYPSITTVLGDKEKAGLAEWRSSLGNARADKETKRCADRGTAVHLMLERYVQNDDNPTAGQRIEHINEFKSLRPAVKRVNNIYCQEVALYSDTLRVAGRVDLIAEYNGKLSIIDFKTSTNDKSEARIEDYFLQTTAYSIMFEEMYGIAVDNVVIIMSSEKGAVPLTFTKPIDAYIEPLLHRVSAYHRKHAEKNK